MRSLIVLTVFCYVCYVSCKTSNVKSLTESMGQEVIEIGAPIKGLNELPPDIDEEPSAEDDDDDLTTTTTPTTTTFTPATKKAPPVVESRRKGSKDIDKIDDREDEDARIEKELAEIYKDNLDYKADIPETTKQTTERKTTTTEKEIVFVTVSDTPFGEEKPMEEEKSILRSKSNKDSGQEKLMLTTDSPKKDQQKSSHSTRITLNILLLLASCYILSTYG